MDDEPLRLVGAREIRDLLGVSRQRVYQLAGRPDFPSPVATLAQGKIWLVNDIEAWIGINRTTPRARRQRPRVTQSDEAAGLLAPVAEATEQGEGAVVAVDGRSQSDASVFARNGGP
jgi:prophage regulatory protein